MSGIWTAWSRSLQQLTPTGKLVVTELALLADSRGVAMVPLKHLSSTTGRTPRAVREALGDLVDAGHLRRDSDLNPPHPFRATRLQLVAATPTRTPLPSKGTGNVHANPETYRYQQKQVRTLRSLLEDCVAANWRGPDAWALATLLEEQGEERFGHLIRNRKRQGIVDDPWDTLTIAWEVAQNNAASLIGANEPWGLWIHLTRIACMKEDQLALSTILVGGESALDALDSEPLSRHMDSEDTTFGVDDFDGVLLKLIQLLVESGVPEAVAWAGTARLLELGQVTESKRHWVAALDAKLQGMGVCENAARAWMTLLVGSRRGNDGVLKSGMVGSSAKLAALIGASFLAASASPTP